VRQRLAHARGPAILLLVLALLAACGEGAGNRRNVLLVVMDTVRADRVTWSDAAPHDTTPFLAELAAGGVVFERALSSSSWTLPAFGSLFTGRIPSRHNAGLTVEFRGRDDVALAQLDSSAWTLAEVLRDEGYRTAAFVNNPFLDPGIGLARGFDTYDFVHADNRNLRRADRLVDRVLDWFSHEADEPWFVVVHFFDPHMDYDPPAAVRGAFTAGYDGFLDYPIDQLDALRAGTLPLEPADEAFLRGVYDEEIRFVDDQLRRLFAGLGPRLDDALVVVTSDHGEELFDHGGFEHGHALFQEVVGVPLLVTGPEVVPARVAAPVGLVDVPVTVLAALELPAPPPGEGRSLWPTLTAGVTPPVRDHVAEGILHGPYQRSLVRWPWKLIETRDAARLRLFHLEDDPGETTDLAPERAELAGELQSGLESIVREATKQRMQNNLARIPPEVRERLRSLGYID